MLDEPRPAAKPFKSVLNPAEALVEPSDSATPASAASMFGWVTVTHLVVIAICAIGAIAILIWGRRLRRQRQEAEREIAESNDEPNGAPPPEP